MTTTAKPKTGQQHNDWKHGPVAAAFNASVWPLTITTVVKLYGGFPPWVPLVVAVVMAGCLVWAGRHRQPRPLSRKSLTYRATVVLAAGGWMWWQLATFPTVAISAHQLVVMLSAWLAGLGFLAMAVTAHRGRIPALVRYAPAGLLLVFAAGLTAVLHRPILGWLAGAFTVVDRMPHTAAVVLPWLGGAALQLLCLAAPAAVLGMAFASRERTADEYAAQAEREAARSSAPAGRAMQALLCRTASETTTIRDKVNGTETPRYHLVVTDVQFWDNRAGERYIVNLTGNQRGTTLTRLRSFTDDLATKLNLPEGCGVEVLPAKGVDPRTGNRYGRGFAAVDVCRVNVMEQLIPYPELKQRSIMNAMPLGKTRRGDEIGPFFRESSAYLWGQKGSGKTGTIFDIITGGLQCTDTIVWGIDLNGGAAFRPFLRPWYEGKVDRPCVDWVATTIGEVQHMAEVGLDIALDRKKFYADLKFEHNTNLMPVGNGEPGAPPPEILIIIDEGATVLGLGGNAGTDEGRAARQTMNQIMDLARDAAVNIVFSGLRATSDVADTAFMRGTSIRIGMRVTDDVELAHGFGDYSLSAREIPYPGSGYICCGHDSSEVVVFKAYFLDPKRMYDVGLTTTPWRPYLDQRGLQVAGPRYATRWRRTAHSIWADPRPEILEYGCGPAPAPAPGGQPAPAPGGTVTAVMDRPADPDPGATRTRTGSFVPPPPGSSFEDMMRHVDRMNAAEKREKDQTGGGPVDPPTSTAPAGGGGGEGQRGQGQPAGPPATPPPAPPDAFDALVANFSVLDQRPEIPMRRPGMTPEQEISANPNSRAILEQLLLTRGPLERGPLHRMLTAGGDWGPPVLNKHGEPISLQALHKLLKEPGADNKPVSWLVERGSRDPYDHKDRLGR